MTDSTFQDHVIKSETTDRVVLQRGDDYYLRTFFTRSQDRLILIGDIDPAIFVTRGGTLRDMIDFIGNSHLDYVAGKWQEGMRMDPKDWNRAKAALDLESPIKEQEAIIAIEGPKAFWKRSGLYLKTYQTEEFEDACKLKEALEEALEAENEGQFFATLSESGMECEDWADLGMVLRKRVKCAHAACQQAALRLANYPFSTP